MNQKNHKTSITTPSKVYLVGAGPGDPALITVRAQEILTQADAILYDHLVSTQLLDLAPDKCERIYVGKRAGKHLYSQDQINRMLIDHAKKFQCVVRLKGGDPLVFGRGAEEALALQQAGICFEIVPGITAGLAVPAYAGIPVTHRGLASDVAFITGHEELTRIDNSQIDWNALAAWKGTIVFYMGVLKIADICDRLIQHGLASDTAAAAISWGTTPKQKTLTATLSELPQKVAQQNLRPPAIIVIGKVVALRDKLKWFEDKPLFAKRIIVTRPAIQGDDFIRKLTELGALVTYCPTIKIAPPQDPQPLRLAAQNLHTYHWIIFTSANAVTALFEQLKTHGKDARSFASAKICAVGPATAEKLKTLAIIPDLIPPEYSNNEILKSITQENLNNKNILLPRGNLASTDLPTALKQKGACVEEVIAYQTLPDESHKQQLNETIEKDQADWITFTSPSTFKNFLTQINPNSLTNKKLRLAAIGPTTSQAIQNAGLTCHVQAENHTTESLIDAIRQTEQR